MVTPCGHPMAVVAYSGGKDSTATLLWAIERYERVVPVFCDTGAEWPETYAYLDYIEKALDLSIVRLHHLHEYTLMDWVRRYRFWPSPFIRSCTSELKRQPLLRWLKGKENYEVLFGQRAEESYGRSLLPEREGYTYRPILRWTKRQVLDYIQAKGLKLNPVYAFVERANCCVCPLTKPSAIREYSRRYPAEFKNWLEVEHETGKTWRSNMSLAQAAQIEQLSLFDTQDFSGCLLDGLCDLGEGDDR